MRDLCYRYALEFFREDGSPVGLIPVTPDWEPALEGTYFLGVRQGRLPAILAVNSGTVSPVWHPNSGEPYVAGFNIAIPGTGSEEVKGQIPTGYIRELAQQTSSTLVDGGRLKPGELFRYLICAFPQCEKEASQKSPFTFEEVTQPLPLDEKTLESFLNKSELYGEDSHGKEDMPVFLPQKVLDEAAALARGVGEVETGGILLGRLHRDSSVPEIFVEVTTQIPASHTFSQTTKLTFTAETWTAARAAIELRKKDELMLGWWHSHPNFCKNCDPDRRKICKLSQPFFSSEDCALQRAIFARAFNLGLLLSDRGEDGFSYSLFGWRQGMIAPRGFYVGPAQFDTVTITREVN